MAHIVKTSSSYCQNGRKYAENEANSNDWFWLGVDEEKLWNDGDVYMGAASTLPDVVADPQDPSDMQAAIGAAHVEQHGDNEDDFNPDLDSESYDDFDAMIDAANAFAETHGVSSDFITLGGEEPNAVNGVILREGESSIEVKDANVDEMAEKAAKLIRDLAAAEGGIGRKNAFLLITYQEGVSSDFFGNIDPATASAAVQVYGLRRMGMPAELADYIGDMLFAGGDVTTIDVEKEEI